MIEVIKSNFLDKAKKSISAFSENLKKIRTGRATVNLLDGVMVDYYGAMTPLNQVASVSTPEARTILVQPWDKGMLKNIEKAIQKAELGFNPIADGAVVRVSIPALTEETRKEIVKDAKNIAEQSRIIIRNLRRDANEAAKKALKEHKITEDNEKQSLDEIQKLTDNYIKEVNTILEKKEKEILEI